MLPMHTIYIQEIHLIFMKCMNVFLQIYKCMWNTQYIHLREKNTFVPIFTNLSCSQDNTYRVNHALICPQKFYKLMYIPAFLYTHHSYKQCFHKLYLSCFVRVLEKIYWEECLSTKQGHRKIKVGIFKTIN